MPPPSDKPAVGFLGLGAMGFGMATHLVRQGYPVKGYDVFPPTVERFQAAGGAVATSLADSARGHMYYVCMVASAPQAQAALFDDKEAVVQALPKNATLILCSTVPASYAQAARDRLIALGREDIYFVDSPVSGGAQRAADGTLSIMAGGSDAALDRSKFLLAEMAAAEKLYLVPGGVGAGSNMKMVHQVLAAIQILAASEAMGFAARLGLDAKTVRDAVVASDAWSWMHENRTPRMLEEDYFPGVSALTIILKDVGIITASSRLNQFPTPLCATAEQVYISGLGRGYDAHDDAGMVRMYFPDPIASTTTTTSSNGPPNSSTEASKIDLVLALLRNIHLCAAGEAVSFARALNVDMAQYYELVNAAAGGTAMFRSRAPAMMAMTKQQNAHKSSSSPAGAESGAAPPRPVNGAAETRSLGKAAEELSAVVQAARDVQCPLHLGTTALNILFSGVRKGLSGESDSSICRVWD